MNSKILRRAVAAGAFLAAIGSLPAFGFRMITNTTVGTVSAGYSALCNDPVGFAHWGSSSISWYLNDSGQGSGKATALQNAMASWTNVADTDHSLSYAGTTSAGWATDGQNTVVWANGNGCTGSCLALTALTLQSGQLIVESDITFNSSYTWQTNGSNYDTEAVAAHEFGHSLGIHHTDWTTGEPTMNAFYIGTIGRSLAADDIAALKCSHDRYFASNPLPSPPATPASLSVSPSYCFGWASFSWSSSTGATYYEVQQSPVSSFIVYGVAYAGPDTYLNYNGGPDYNYYRVRACNWGGCSGYRNGDQGVAYYDPCL